MTLGKCELCNVKAVELHDVSGLNAWPIERACAPCKSELIADDDDPTEPYPKEFWAALVEGCDGR